ATIGDGGCLTTRSSCRRSQSTLAPGIDGSRRRPPASNQATGHVQAPTNWSPQTRLSLAEDALGFGVGPCGYSTRLPDSTTRGSPDRKAGEGDVVSSCQPVTDTLKGVRLDRPALSAGHQVHRRAPSDVRLFPQQWSSVSGLPHPASREASAGLGGQP